MKAASSAVSVSVSCPCSRPVLLADLVPAHHGVRAGIFPHFLCAAQPTSLTACVPRRASHFMKCKYLAITRKVEHVESGCHGVCAEKWQAMTLARWEVTQEIARSWPLHAAHRPGVLSIRPNELLVTTTWKDVDLAEVSALLYATKQNCDRFPKVDADGAILKVDPVKLKRAIQHSVVVVALSIRGKLDDDYYMDRPVQEEDRPWLAKRTLVAFGRASSDRSLTASIHDLAVAPSLQRQGVGRRLLQRIVREIVRYGISDISVMADRNTLPFFRACGFGSDILGSTTMMYTAADNSSDIVGTNLLGIPPPPLQESWTFDSKLARSKQTAKNVTRT